jgi:hypothetical protein
MKWILLAFVIIATGLVAYIAWDEMQLHSVRPGETKSEVTARLGPASHTERAPVEPFYLPSDQACRARGITETLVYKRTMTRRPSLFVYLDGETRVQCVNRAMLVTLSG